MSEMQAEFDPKALRRTFGTFATGVAVITVRGAAGLMGLTVNSLTSVSLSPPLMLWSLGRESNRFSAYAYAPEFGVNILSHGQSELSDRFSKVNPYYNPDEDFVAADEHLRLKDAIGWMSCKTYQTIDLGDHVLIVGEVLAFDQIEGAGLTYFRGRYGMTS